MKHEAPFARREWVVGAAICFDVQKYTSKVLVVYIPCLDFSLPAAAAAAAGMGKGKGHGQISLVTYVTRGSHDHNHNMCSRKGILLPILGIYVIYIIYITSSSQTASLTLLSALLIIFVCFASLLYSTTYCIHVYRIHIPHTDYRTRPMVHYNTNPLKSTTLMTSASGNRISHPILQH